MTEYRVMVKGKHDKRFHCYGHHTESKYADNSANSLAASLWTAKVKVIAKDDNGVTNELIYK